MKKTLTIFGKILLWTSWFYPFLRLFVIVPIAALEDTIGGVWTKNLLDIAKYIHGGALVSELISSVYMVYFVLSVGAFLYWHYKKKIRISWGKRIVLGFVTFFNFFNIYIMYGVATGALVTK